MELKILCPQWGHEHLPVEEFFTKVKEAGYDGIDTWLPESRLDRIKFVSLLEEFGLCMVSHQHQAEGRSIQDFCKSVEHYLNLSLESNPILINSHSGRDYFTIDEQLRVIDTAEEFSEKHNIRVVHETHRGRLGYSPMNSLDLFRKRPNMKITADFSHWVCVTESYLENHSEALEQAIKRTEHIHARVGFPEGPQISDPRNPYWQKDVQFFLTIWKQILSRQVSLGQEVFTVTPEFGPAPYMWIVGNTNSPIVDQWEINCYMKGLLRNEFSEFVPK